MSGRKKPEDRRDEILRGALAVIARRGFADVTTRDVANEIGVTHGLLHHYFPSRGGLIAAAFDRFAAEQLVEMRAVLQRVPHPTARLALLCAPPSPSSYLLWTDAWSEAPRNADLREILRDHTRAWEALIAAVVVDGTATGAFTPVAPAKRVAKAVIAMLDGLAVQMVAMDLIGTAEYRRFAYGFAEHQVGLAPGVLAPPRRAPRGGG